MMDATLIQEIANQLGMAVDQAGQFIQEQLPQFAALKAMQASIPITVCIVLAVIAIVLGIVIVANAKRLSESGYPEVIVAGLVVATAIAVCSIYGIVSEAVNVIGWSNYPEAMLIDMAIKAVG